MDTTKAEIGSLIMISPAMHVIVKKGQGSGIYRWPDNRNCLRLVYGDPQSNHFPVLLPGQDLHKPQ